MTAANYLKTNQANPVPLFGKTFFIMFTSKVFCLHVIMVGNLKENAIFMIAAVQRLVSLERVFDRLNVLFSNIFYNKPIWPNMFTIET